MVKSVSDIRKDEITDAVLSILVEEGPLGLNARTVSERVGMAKSSLYQHFNNLEDILLAAIEKLHGRMEDVVYQADQRFESPLAMLHLLSTEVPKMAPLHSAFPMLRLQAGQQGNPWICRLKERKQRFQAYLINVMGRLVEDGQTREDLNANELFVLFSSLHRALMMEWVERDLAENFDGEAKISQTWELFCKLALKPSADQSGKARGQP